MNSFKVQRDRVSVVVVSENKLLCFRAEDPSTHQNYIFIPGGRIESGESAEQTAIRETLEETGYHIRIENHLILERRYDFTWNSQINDCRTQFLKGELTQQLPLQVNDADYHRGVVWIPIAEIESTFFYHRDILEPILYLLGTYSFSAERSEILPSIK